MFGGGFLNLPPGFAYLKTPFPYQWPEIELPPVQSDYDYLPEPSSKEEKSEALVFPPSSPSPELKSEALVFPPSSPSPELKSEALVFPPSSPSPELSSKEEKSEALVLPSSPLPSLPPPSPPPISLPPQQSPPPVSLPPQSPPPVSLPPPSPPYSPQYEPPEPGELPEFVIYEDIIANPEIIDLKTNPEQQYFGRAGLECYNFQKGTNLEFHDFFKLESTKTSLDLGIYAAVGRTSGWEIETCVAYEDCLRLIIMLRCGKLGNCVGGFDNLSVDASFKGDMPYCLANETLRNDEKLDDRIYYWLENSEVEEYKQLFEVYAQLALLTHFESLKLVCWAMPLQVASVLVQTRPDVAPKDKVKADHAIFYIRFLTRHGFCFLAIIRRTSDGNPHHISLEVKCLSY
ncbi:unnamed protein product [Microthlaspi erraticum]|uniref:Uncharacterized protein n=1 Tax=Microthlaspi erraticum TaxID=1685480 RepID=A0A6D2JHW3_9BRAS|nr:unnamed protein product [Microthlaspi erraticum]